MSKCYGHITPQQRLKIHQLLIQGCAIQEIAEQLGYHRATLYRELARNSCQYGYRLIGPLNKLYRVVVTVGCLSCTKTSALINLLSKNLK